MATKKKKGINFQKLLGLAAGIYLTDKFIEPQLDKMIPEMNNTVKGGALAVGADFLGEMKFVKDSLKDENLRNGLITGIQAVGAIKAMKGAGITGIGQNNAGLEDDDEFAVVIEGVEDEALAIYDGDEDLDVVSVDVLADDDQYNDDLDIISVDILADDDDDYDEYDD